MEVNKKIFSWNHFIILILGMLTCGWVSVLQGKELGWDLAYYHYYNPFAFLHARWKMDYWPHSFMQSYLTPTFDFITYFLINTFSPIVTTFIIGAIHGINFWILYCIANLMLSPSTNKFYFAMALAFLGLYAPTVLTGIGSFQHDDLLSIFVLGFVYWQLHFFSSDSHVSIYSKSFIFFFHQ